MIGRSALRRIILAVATGFGAGYSPIASGTVGSLPGVFLVWAIWSRLADPFGQALVALGLALMAVPVCAVAERAFGQKDDRRIVADEYLTFPLCVIGLPVLDHPWLFAVAFVTCRGFDILKLWPADGLQRLRSGWGIVADDFFASLYSLALNHLLWWAVHMR